MQEASAGETVWQPKQLHIFVSKPHYTVTTLAVQSGRSHETTPLAMHLEIGLDTTGLHELVPTLGKADPVSCPVLGCGEAELERLPDLGERSQRSSFARQSSALLTLEPLKVTLPGHRIKRVPPMARKD